MLAHKHEERNGQLHAATDACLTAPADGSGPRVVVLKRAPVASGPTGDGAEPSSRPGRTRRVVEPVGLDHAHRKQLPALARRTAY